MEKKLKKLKEFLKEELKDCLELQNKKELTMEGYGMLIMIKSIYEKMNWKLPDEDAEDL